MRRADERRPVLVRDVREEAAERERGRDVDTRGRLVGEDHRRAGRERPRDGDALALPGREDVGGPVGVLAEADGDERVDRPLVRLERPRRRGSRGRARRSRAPVRKPVEPGRLADERDRVAAEAGAGIAVERRDRDPADHDLALVRHVEPRDEGEQRRLPRAGRPGHDREPARRERRRDGVERHVLAVPARHARSSTTAPAAPSMSGSISGLSRSAPSGRSSTTPSPRRHRRAVDDPGVVQRLLGDPQPAAASDHDRRARRRCAPR